MIEATERAEPQPLAESGESPSTHPDAVVPTAKSPHLRCSSRARPADSQAQTIRVLCENARAMIGSSSLRNTCSTHAYAWSSSQRIQSISI